MAQSNKLIRISSPKTGRKPYSKHEDDVIDKHVGKNASNLRFAFELAAQEIGRNADAVSAHYYAKIKTDPNRKIMVLGTRSGAVVNTKQTARRATKDEPSPILESMCFMASKLSAAERKQMIKLLVDAS